MHSPHISKRVRGLLALFVLLGSSFATAEDLEVHFIDVGQGDSILLRNDGRAVLVDTGSSDFIVSKLRELGVGRLDLLIATHGHVDHLAGAEAILAELTVLAYLDNGGLISNRAEAKIARLIRSKGIDHIRANHRSHELGDVRLHILPPPIGINLLKENNASLGVIVERGTFQALLTGDSELEELNAWLETDLIRDVEILKAAHHGSRNAVTPTWLHRTNPEVVVISVGADNNYGHPDPWALQYYAAANRHVFRTDRDGDVLVRIDEQGRYGVATDRGENLPFPEPAGEAVAQACCRICRQSKPCGDGCISRRMTCHSPPGCACSP